MVRILLVASDPRSHNTLRMMLPAGWGVQAAGTGRDIRSSIGSQQPDVVLIDCDDEPETIEHLVRRATAGPLSPPVVVLSALRSDSVIVRSIQAGALDFVVKPFSARRLLDAFERAAVAGATADSRASSVAPDAAGERFLGGSRSASQVRSLIRSYSEVDVPVLLQGESGTGKDLVAQLIHDLSARAAGPFEPVNCAAVPESLFESEVFGSERGAFTGAVSRPGLFERGHGGTLFLDEIGEASPRAQVKLLRVIESGSVVRIGGRRAIPIDSRLISATNRDLHAQMEQGAFRSELFYRISVLPLVIPPLRERVEDIPVLARFWLEQLGSGEESFTAAAVERLASHRWPGNVRELRNVVQRSLLLGDGNSVDAARIQFA